jgi:hypothetical protein
LKTRPTSRLKLPRSSSKFINRAVGGKLPALEGRAIRISFRSALTVSGRRLYSNRISGQPVHAATFIRKREIVCDRELQGHPREFARILIHEVFHFAWVRLGNSLRRSYAELLRNEWKKRARGELGWSAEWRKMSLRRLALAPHGGRWNEYVCESFCDTAAWVYSGNGKHDEFTLALRHRRRRAEWFQAVFADRGIPI